MTDEQKFEQILTKKQQILVQKYIADIKSYVQKDVDSLNKKRERNARYYRKQRNAEEGQENFKTSYQPSDGRPIEEIEEKEEIYIYISKNFHYMR